MQIQCPHCKSRYRLGDEMVDAYGGFVRCGNCNYKFNIHDLPTHARKDDTQLNGEVKARQGKQGGDSAGPGRSSRIEPRLERDEAEEALNIRFHPDGEAVEEQDVTDALETGGYTEPRLDAEGTPEAYDPLENFSFDEENEAPAVELEDEMRAHAPDAIEVEPVEIESRADTPDIETQSADADETASEAHEGVERASEPSEAEAAPLEEVEDEEADEDVVELPAEGDRQRSEPVFTPDDSEPQESSEPLLFASLDDYEPEEDSSSVTLISDEIEQEDEEPGRSRVLLTMVWRSLVFLFWLAAAAALGWLLYGQVRDTLYPAYRHLPMVQNARTIACAYIPCKESQYDTELYEIVVSRMDETGGGDRQLHVSIFLLNQAESPQEYPNILLSLKTIDGTTVGQRVISPEEYFTAEDSLLSSGAESGEAAKRSMIKPNKLGKILIKLDNPPAEAVGFEARVVE